MLPVWRFLRKHPVLDEIVHGIGGAAAGGTIGCILGMTTGVVVSLKDFNGDEYQRESALGQTEKYAMWGVKGGALAGALYASPLLMIVSCCVGTTGVYGVSMWHRVREVNEDYERRKANAAKSLARETNN